MTYSTPELQRVGAARSLVLGGGKGLGDNVEVISPDEYVFEEIPFVDEAEW